MIARGPTPCDASSETAVPRVGSEGFSLVEGVLGITLFGIGLLGVVGMSLLAARNYKQATTLDLAVARAQEVMDSLIAEAASSPTPPVPSGELVEPPFFLRWESQAMAGAVDVRLSAFAAGEELPLFTWFARSEPGVP